MNIRLLKKGDMLLIFVIVILAALLLGWNTFGARLSSDQQLTAVIKHNGQVIQQINLSRVNNPETLTYSYEGIRQVIVAEKGRIRFSESDCPDKICVKTGWLNKPGDKSVCMPSKVVITIVGENKKVDSIAY